MAGDDHHDPFRRLDEQEVRRLTGGGLVNASPLVKLVNVFRGRGDYEPCPHCRELRHPEATVCPHCQRDIATS